MIEALSYPFLQRAVLASVLVGAMASYFGVFVVQRRMSFLGAGLAHAAFGGVALGLLLGAEPLVVALPFTIVVAIGINVVRRRTRLAGDTAVGVFFAVAVALGLIFLALRRSVNVDAFAYLFGSVLAVSTIDLLVGGAMTIMTALTIPRLWGRWAYASFDRDAANADRLPVERDDYILFVFLAITVVVSVKMVGIILMAAFLVIPAATARLAAARFSTMTVISVTVGVLSSLAGLALAYVADLPSGATIVLVQAALFAGAAIIWRT
ncbi:MAG: metal ABC transporter permease [Rhodothermales bacterium]|nr:metal ABC transporter permease [Rhodothermales bacterium]MBO6781391.1 metal ABC transporter permease [Rhodothermales bacterium]